MYGIAENLFHFVNDQDPVPRLLSYAHSLSALSRQLDNQVGLGPLGKSPSLKEPIHEKFID